jgi:hypothetical protein
MTFTWYCTDCGEQLNRGEVESHEAQGHHVKGHLRPDRLLPGDPWSIDAMRDQGGED